MSDLKNSSRRTFVKKAAYVAPAVLTLKAAPSFASLGSSRHDGNTGGSTGGHNNTGGKKRKTW
jgi:hypothetical protein